jgi:hypothetical protein
MLDRLHHHALRAVAQGSASEEDVGAIRNLAVAGLVAPVDGAWTLTQTGHAVLEIEGGQQTDTSEAGDLKAKVRAWFMS